MDSLLSATVLAIHAVLCMCAVGLAARSLLQGRRTRADLLLYAAVFGWCGLRAAYWMSWERRGTCPVMVLNSAAVAVQCIGSSVVCYVFLARLYQECWTHPTLLCDATPEVEASAPAEGEEERRAEGAQLLSAHRAYGACDTAVGLSACSDGSVEDPLRNLSFVSPVRDLSFVSPGYSTPQPLVGRCAPWRWRGASVTAVAAGVKHTVVVAGGCMYSCGNGLLGQLGLGMTADFDILQPLGPAMAPWGASPVTAVAAGEDHTVILAGGKVYACGFNRFGQLGLGHFTECDTARAVGGPQAPWGDAAVTHVAAGEDHTLLLAGGTLYVCGCNDLGQLGLGDKVNRNRPEALLGDCAPWGTDGVTALAAGNKHSILLAGGKVYGCGTNDNGQLGLGNSPGSQTFRLVEGPWGATPVTDITTGDNHTVVLVGGRVYAFGSGSNGQLGLGTRQRMRTPQLLEGPNAPWGDTPVTLTAARTYHSVFVAGCNLYSCGNNYHGQLGLGDNVDRDRPELLREPPWGAHPITAVTTGRDHTAVAAGGQLYTFGNHRHGQLGVGKLAEDEDTANGAPDDQPHVHHHGMAICCFLPCPALPCGQKWQVRISRFHYAFCAVFNAFTILALEGLTWHTCQAPSIASAFDLDRWVGLLAFGVLLLSFSWCCHEATQQSPPLCTEDVPPTLILLSTFLVVVAALRCIYGWAAPWLGQVVPTDASGVALPVLALVLEVLWYIIPAVAVLAFVSSPPPSEYSHVPSDDEVAHEA